MILAQYRSAGYADPAGVVIFHKRLPEESMGIGVSCPSPQDFPAIASPGGRTLIRFSVSS
jgi:hypothetical protein